ncbi:MAG: FliM/FliN family flagellar motor switch protein [Sedimentisphaerales bacterium]|nr:FliM/FliN family flagellar motor switch protein [Sedimentisphaerales bacterium]
MSKDRIQQLLKAVGSMPQADDSSIECIDYNWQEPHCFNNDQLAKLDMFAQNIAVTLSEKFSAFCRAQFEVEITSVSLNYAREFLAETDDNQRDDFYLLFGSGPGKEFGVIEIPDQTASIWSKQLLGDSELNESQERELSQLEQSLLCDLASVLVSSFSAANTKIESNPINNIVSGLFPLKLKETEEVCRITFSVKQEGSDVISKASFIIPCTRLEVVTGKNKYSQNESPDQDFSQTILEHIKTLSVGITAQLECSQLSFEDMMNMQVNDIIILDKQIGEPFDLIVNNHTFGYGLPVKSDGKYAIKIAATEY